MKLNDVSIPSSKLVEKILMKYKKEVFYKKELVEKIEKEFDVVLKQSTVKYHANKLVESEKPIERYKLGQNEGIVYGYEKAIKKLEKRFEI